MRSPESNGVSEAFVKTLKRDYADTVLARLGSWIADTTNTTRIAGSECARLASSSALKPNLPRVRFDGGNSKAFSQKRPKWLVTLLERQLKALLARQICVKLVHIHVMELEAAVWKRVAELRRAEGDS